MRLVEEGINDYDCIKLADKHIIQLNHANVITKKYNRLVKSPQNRKCHIMGRLVLMWGPQEGMNHLHIMYGCCLSCGAHLGPC